MKPLLSLKTLLRSPARTVLTFILLGVVSFAFFTQVSEYAVIRREFNYAASQYRGVGAAEAAQPVKPELRWPSSTIWRYSGPATPLYIEADPRISQDYSDEERAYYLDEIRYQPLTEEQVAAISELPYISVSDTRYMTAGVSADYYRLDDKTYFYPYSSRCIIEGTLTEIKLDSNMFRTNQLFLDDCELLAGNFQLAIDSDDLIICAISFAPSETLPFAWQEPNRIFTICKPNYKYTTEYIETLVPGQRYVFVVRFDPILESQFYLSSTPPISFQHIKENILHLGDHLTDPWCEAIQSIEGEPENYLETEKYSALRELIEITNSDLYTFDVVYTQDMSAIMRFAEGDMAIIDGRTLTREDSENGASVCVISRELARTYELEVEDSITLTLGTALFEQYKGLGAVAATRQRYSPPVENVTLKIVGIYADIGSASRQKDQPHWNYSINTIFVPASLLPVDGSQLSDHEFSPAEFSFVIDNAWDIPAFLEGAELLFDELGLKLIFNDGGWIAIADEFRAAQTLSVINIVVFSAAVVFATGFSVYLFIGRKKSEYAVMRALGTRKDSSARALILPLMSVAGASVLAGSGVAWIGTVNRIGQNNALLTLQTLEDFAVTISIPVWVILGCILGELILALLFALVMLRRLGKLSPLELLQRSGAREKLKQKRTSAVVFESAISMSESTIRGSDAYLACKGAGSGKVRTSHGFVPRYIFRHMRRVVWKSALLLLLASLLLCAIGQLVLMRQSYDDLFNNTVITARFAGGLSLERASRIAGSELTVNPYYEAVGAVDANYENVDFIFTNNIARYTGEDAEIIYADGYDETCMEQIGDIVIVGEAFFELHGLELGSVVLLTHNGLYLEVENMYVNQYISKNPDSDATRDEIVEINSDRIAQETRRQGVVATVVGVAATPSGKFGNTLFSPGMGVGSIKKVQAPEQVEFAEYAVADNERIEEFREYCIGVVGGGATDNVMILDTDKIENIRNTRRLLSALYPIVLAAALLIGGFLCSLIILQSSKEAAIMRALGTTKAKTRAILSLEQIFLSTVGLAVGVCVMLILKRHELTAIREDLAIFAAAYFAVILTSAVTCSTLATRRSVLELLQTKE